MAREMYLNVVLRDGSASLLGMSMSAEEFGMILLHCRAIRTYAVLSHDVFPRL